MDGDCLGDACRFPLSSGRSGRHHAISAIIHLDDPQRRSWLQYESPVRKSYWLAWAANYFISRHLITPKRPLRPRVLTYQVCVPIFRYDTPTVIASAFVAATVPAN